MFQPGYLREDFTISTFCRRMVGDQEGRGEARGISSERDKIVLAEGGRRRMEESPPRGEGSRLNPLPKIPLIDTRRHNSTVLTFSRDDGGGGGDGNRQ